MSYERFEPARVPPWKRRLRLYWKLLRGDRPIGVLLGLYPGADRASVPCWFYTN